MNDCIFCKICNKELSSDIIYEDEHCVCFSDINPQAKTHLLFVPKVHISSISEMEDGHELIVAHLIKIARNVAKDLKLPGYKLHIAVNKEGGQTVFHIHLHLLSHY